MVSAYSLIALVGISQVSCFDVNENRNFNEKNDLNMNINVNVNFTNGNYNIDRCKSINDAFNSCTLNGTITYYEHENGGGRAEKVNLTRQCHNVKMIYQNVYFGISHINAQGNCIKLYVTPNCVGEGVYFVPGMKSVCDAFVPNCGLQDKIKSIRLC